MPTIGVKRELLFKALGQVYSKWTISFTSFVMNELCTNLHSTYALPGVVWGSCGVGYGSYCLLAFEAVRSGGLPSRRRKCSPLRLILVSTAWHPRRRNLHIYHLFPGFDRCDRYHILSSKSDGLTALEFSVS